MTWTAANEIIGLGSTVAGLGRDQEGVSWFVTSSELIACKDLEAYAHLMAASPDLLKALKWAMGHGCLTYVMRTKANTSYCDAVDFARAAIAKAEPTP